MLIQPGCIKLNFDYNGDHFNFFVEFHVLIKPWAILDVTFGKHG